MTAPQVIARVMIGALMTATVPMFGACLPTQQQKLAEAPPPARYTGPKRTVMIGGFTSVSPQLVSTDAASDIMVTALLQSGAFTVIDTAAAPPPKTNRGSPPYDFILKGTVSEATVGAHAGTTQVKVGGMETTSSQGADGIGVDVRIIDARTGVVLDAVTVRKEVPVKSSGTKGLGKLLGKYVKEVRDLDVDVDTSQSEQASTEATLRTCIEEAVMGLAQRLVISAPAPSPATAGQRAAKAR